MIAAAFAALLALGGQTLASVETDDEKAVATLYAEQETCRPGLRRVVLEIKNRRDAGTYLGCWIEMDGKVYMLFDDGDKFIVPREAFTWRRWL